MEENREYILCAATHFEDDMSHIHQPKNIITGYVICGHRHHNVFATLSILEIDRLKGVDSTQGFITNTNIFLDRKEALKVAIEANQLKIGNQCNYKGLYSEDLY